MHTLTIIRHGTFAEGTDYLDAKGVSQMNELASNIKMLEVNKIFSSFGPRAHESAHIIGANLQVPVEAYLFFGSDVKEEQGRYYNEALGFIELENQKDTVIVTKGEWVKAFIPYFVKYISGNIVSEVVLERGEAIMIDCESGALSEMQ